MSTPTKRRKTDAYRGSQQPVGSIDFFFKKARDSNDNASTRKSAGHDPQSTGHLEIDEQVKTETRKLLTDEELARKLQEEWDNAGGLGVGTPNTDPADSFLRTIPNESEGSKPSPSGDVALTPGNSKECSRQSNHTSNVASISQTRTLSLQSTTQTEDTISSTVPFDENPLTFDPQKYLPELQRYWSTLDGQASYGILIRCFVLVNSTQSRIKIVDTLVNFLRTIIEGNPDSLLPAVCKAILRKPTNAYRHPGMASY